MRSRLFVSHVDFGFEIFCMTSGVFGFLVTNADGMGLLLGSMTPEFFNIAFDVVSGFSIRATALQQRLLALRWSFFDYQGLKKR